MAQIVSVATLAGALLIPTGVAPASAQTVPQLGPVDVARQAGVYRYMRSWSVNVADVNNDGNPDMFVPEHDPESSQRGENIPNPHMFMGSSTGHFTDRGWPGPVSDRHDCTWGDVNNDGRPDMFCAVGLTSSSVNELWMQNADGTFTNKAAAYGITANTHGRYRTSSIIDANNDGWPDIFVTRYSGANGDPGNPLPPETNPYPNELWISRGTTRRWPISTRTDYPI
ncbi:MAG: VCBS repeat-containing protein [Actinobacteria bacterium]|nr:VCBS repeat-containing protein [Actinomycetota bacterium]